MSFRAYHVPIKFIVLITWVFYLYASGCTVLSKYPSSKQPPPDFQPLAEVDLFSRSFDEEVVGQFTIEETADVTIDYTLPNLDTTYFDLSLAGADGEILPILYSENYRTDANGGGMWEQRLTPGTYRLMLSADRSPGKLAVYWRSGS